MIPIGTSPSDGPSAPTAPPAIRRFAFLVHPLSPASRRIIGLRTANADLLRERRSGDRPEDAGIIARVWLSPPSSRAAPPPNVPTERIEGIIVAVPLLAEEILADQQRALRLLIRAAQIAAPVAHVGLGGALSVVAGRGAALQEAIGLPVTTGNAATAWAATALCRQLLDPSRAPSPRVAVLGAKGTVGRAVLDLLRADHIDATPDPDDLASYPLVAGCHTTGIGLDPARLHPRATLIDVALPRTLASSPPPGVRVVKGESLSLPPGWGRDGWGWLLHLLAGYGTRSVYACLIEPLVAIAASRAAPWQQGKKLTAQTVREFGQTAESLGFHPEIRNI